MTTQEFITNVIAPRATRAAIAKKVGGRIDIGPGNPYFENQHAVNVALTEVFREVAEKVEDEYKEKLDEVYYEHRTLVFLQRGFGQEASKEFKVKIEDAQKKVQSAFHDYQNAVEANSFVRNNLR